MLCYLKSDENRCSRRNRGYDVEMWSWALSSKNITLYVPCLSEQHLRPVLGDAFKSEVQLYFVVYRIEH
jgi:hypothetical protein